MIGWSIVSLLIAIVLALIGFSGVVLAVTLFAKILFFLALIFFLIFLILMFIHKAEKG